MWFRNLKICRLSGAWKLFDADLEAALARNAYQPGNNLEMPSRAGLPRAKTADWPMSWAGKSC